MTSRKTHTPAWTFNRAHAHRWETRRLLQLLLLFTFARRKRNVHNLAKHNWSQRQNSTTNCGDPQSHQSQAKGNLNRQELRSITSNIFVSHTAVLCMSWSRVSFFFLNQEYTY